MISKTAQYLKRGIVIMPIVAIVGASFFPLQPGTRQLLVLCMLIWFNIFILFDVLGK